MAANDSRKRRDSADDPIARAMEKRAGKDTPLKPSAERAPVDHGMERVGIPPKRRKAGEAAAPETRPPPPDEPTFFARSREERVAQARRAAQRVRRRDQSPESSETADDASFFAPRRVFEDEAVPDPAPDSAAEPPVEEVAPERTDESFGSDEGLEADTKTGAPQNENIAEDPPQKSAASESLNVASLEEKTSAPDAPEPESSPAEATERAPAQPVEAPEPETARPAATTDAAAEPAIDAPQPEPAPSKPPKPEPALESSVPAKTDPATETAVGTPEPEPAPPSAKTAEPAPEPTAPAKTDSSAKPVTESPKPAPAPLAEKTSKPAAEVEPGGAPKPEPEPEPPAATDSGADAEPVKAEETPLPSPAPDPVPSPERTRLLQTLAARRAGKKSKVEAAETAVEKAGPGAAPRVAPPTPTAEPAKPVAEPAPKPDPKPQAEPAADSADKPTPRETVAALIERAGSGMGGTAPAEPTPEDLEEPEPKAPRWQRKTSADRAAPADTPERFDLTDALEDDPPIDAPSVDEPVAIPAAQPKLARTPAFAAFEWMIASRYLRARRKEGFISVIAGFSLVGIALGVAALIVVMAVMSGFRATLIEQVVGVNAHVNVTAQTERFEDYDPLAATLLEVDGVTSVTPLVQGQVLATSDRGHSGVIVRGMRKDDLERLKIVTAPEISHGSLDDFEADNGVAIGTRLAAKLGLRVGDFITLISPDGDITPFSATPMPRTKDYRILYTFQLGLYEYDSAFVYMPLGEAQIYFNKKEVIDSLEVMVEDPNRVEDYVGPIRQSARRSIGIYTWKDLNSGLIAALDIERKVMFIILTLIILVAALNIISGLVMLVKDKTRDIAIMRTMGIARGSILRIFFICGASIGVVGSIAGVILGVLFVWNIGAIQRFIEGITGASLWDPSVRMLSEIPAKMVPSDLILTLGIALGLSFLATLFPAWKAARLDPVEALRYE